MSIPALISFSRSIRARHSLTPVRSLRSGSCSNDTKSGTAACTFGECLSPNTAVNPSPSGRLSVLLITEVGIWTRKREAQLAIREIGGMPSPSCGCPRKYPKSVERGRARSYPILRVGQEFFRRSRMEVALRALATPTSKSQIANRKSQIANRKSLRLPKQRGACRQRQEEDDQQSVTPKLFAWPIHYTSVPILAWVRKPLLQASQLGWAGLRCGGWLGASRSFGTARFLS